MENSVTIRDNRNGQEVTLPIEIGSFGETAVSGPALSALGPAGGEPALRVLDPGFRNTASCKSRVTYVDGDQGILSYRGYAIEDLAASRSFTDIAYLILNDTLPDAAESKAWDEDLTAARVISQDITHVVRSYPTGSHAMGMLVGVVGGLSTFVPDRNEFGAPELRLRHTIKAIGAVSSVAGYIRAHTQGRSCLEPSEGQGFVYDVARTLLGDEDPHPTLVRALDILFTLHADHEQNCSANVMRSIASAGADPYTALSGAMGALYGPAHGGANEAVLRMLEEIGSVDGVSAYVERAKNKELRLMGVGHPVYRHYDPRAKLIKQVAYDVFEVTGQNEMTDIALEVERHVLSDDYFVSRKLNPNVDFYSGLIYQSLGLPLDMMTVMFAIPRTVGWMAQWMELLEDPDFTITRPRQIYVGEKDRSL